MIPSRSWLLAGAAFLPGMLVPPAMAQTAPAPVHRFHDDHVLGTSMELVVVGSDGRSALRALAAAKGEIGRLDTVLSGWRDDSELARLNAADGPVKVSTNLYEVIAQCEAFRSASGGAFSARIGAAEAAWRRAEQDGVLPEPMTLAETAARAEAADVKLDPVARTIDRGGVIFAIDGLAKGYVIDQALDAASRAAPGVAGLMLDIGGDLRCRGSSPEPGGWRIGVARGGDADNLIPALTLKIAGGAVATSGPGARDRRIGDQAVPHMLLPATGAAAGARTVTVVAPTAAKADALASALAVQPTKAGLALAALHGAQAYILEADGAAATTAGWTSLVLPVRQGVYRPNDAPKLVRALSPASAPWPAGFQLTIDYEIPELAIGRYRPPFVAVWITDQRGKLVRTLFHLGNHPPRYLDSNYVWWRAFDADGQGREKLATVTRPSRRPGRYNVVWDGKDDAGNSVGQGHYVVNIEMSREHGGHSLQTIPLDLARAPVSGTAPGQGESGTADAHYERASI
jgi:thiamine biosynthesis lipoprotein